MDEVNNYHFYRDDEGKLKQVCLTTGDETFADLPVKKTPFKYTLPIAQQIVQRVREGKSISAIAKEAGMPKAAVVYDWSRLHPDFREALDMARRDRAEYYHDKVIAEVEELSEKEDVPVVKERVSAYKWAAEKGNPEKYGKAKSEGGIGNVTIVVDTGIPAPQPVTVEAECQIIQTEEDTTTH